MIQLVAKDKFIINKQDLFIKTGSVANYLIRNLATDPESLTDPSLIHS